MTGFIDILEDEHQIIVRVLEVIEAEVARLDAGGTPDSHFIELAISFFQEFADKAHHGKEEALLFPLLAAKKNIIRDGPIKVLLAEHESGRYFARELRAGLLDLAAGDAKATPRIRRALSLYAQMLRKHIAKEEEIVFLLAQVLLSEEETASLALQFQQDQEKAPPRALDIVRELESIAPARKPLSG